MIKFIRIITTSIMLKISGQLALCDFPLMTLGFRRYVLKSIGGLQHQQQQQHCRHQHQQLQHHHRHQMCGWNGNIDGNKIKPTPDFCNNKTPTNRKGKQISGESRSKLNKHWSEEGFVYFLHLPPRLRSWKMASWLPGCS